MALKDFSNQFLNLFEKLSLLQKVALGAATLTVVISTTVLVLWANAPSYKVLYNNISNEDLEDVVEYLTKDGMKYKVIKDGDVGNAVEVPFDAVYDTRVKLAEMGLPKEDTIGFELFDTASFGMTEQQQNVSYQRALQGELSATIASMSEIAEAKVLITVPKDRLFAVEEEDSKASVVIKFMPNITFTQAQIRAVSHLVSAAVKGLKPENVQIVDTSGNLLSEFLTEANQPFLLSQTQLEQQRKEEKIKEASLNDILSRIVGDGKFVAKVNLNMDFNKREILEEIFDQNPVLRSQQTLEIVSKSYGQGPSGIPGVESNLAEPDILIDNILSEYNKNEETQNYEISKKVVREEKTGGEVKRMTISVVLDHQEVAGTDGAIERKPRAEEDLVKIKANIASAVGFDPARGDVIEVSNISFDTSDGSTSVASKLASLREKNMQLVLSGMKYLTAVVILILFYFLAIRPILRRLDVAREIDDDLLGESALDAQLAGLDLSIGGDSAMPKSLADLEREIESELEDSVPLDVEAVKSKVMLKKIEEQANEDPEVVANLLKAYIKGN